MSINKHLTESLSKNNFEQLSTAGSMASLKSGYDRDLITKFDDKRRAKYSLLKDLQAHDQGMCFFYNNTRSYRRDWKVQDKQVHDRALYSDSPKVWDRVH